MSEATPETGPVTLSATSYPKYVQRPVQWAGIGWSGENLTEIDALFSTHGITATVMQAGTDTLLIMIDGGSQTYAVGEQVVICNDGGTMWRLEAARRNLDGLVPADDYYVGSA